MGESGNRETVHFLRLSGESCGEVSGTIALRTGDLDGHGERDVLLVDISQE